MVLFKHEARFVGLRAFVYLVYFGYFPAQL